MAVVHEATRHTIPTSDARRGVAIACAAVKDAFGREATRPHGAWSSQQLKLARRTDLAGHILLC